jgi:nitrate reductase gamma subunit
VAKAVIYSNTAAMSPMQKESAYKHLPTYIAGIIFHLGSFLALLLYVLAFFNKTGIWFCTYWWIPACLACFLLVSSLCGLSLFLKRLFSKKLRPFSNLDDYFSSGIVALFQLFSAVLLGVFLILPICNFLEDSSNILFPFIKFFEFVLYGYYITATILFIYLPFGKLKHVVYYFAARYHLGFFYGWRNVWGK